MFVAGHSFALLRLHPTRRTARLIHDSPKWAALEH
jgi:hypothetical protein